MQKKKLKLRIVKFDGLLVFEQIENTVMTRLGQKTEHFEVRDMNLFVGFDWWAFAVQGKVSDYRNFTDNVARDAYLQKVFGWISDELFGGGGKLEVGKECLVSEDGKEWSKNHLLAILPKNKKYRYIVCSNLENEKWTYCEYAKPINDSLKIDGDVYTWEV